MVIRDVSSDGDRAAVRKLLEKEFEVRAGVGAAFSRLYDSLSGIRSRIVVESNRIVGHALCAKRLFNLDTVEVPGAILAMLVVDPAFQGRGIGSALVADAEAIAVGDGAPLIHAAGDLDYYSRFGYVDGYVSSRAEFEPRKVKGVDSDALLPARISHAASLARLSSVEAPAGSVVCDEARWRWVLETNHPASLLEKNDVLLGFNSEQDFCLLMNSEPTGFLRIALGEKRLAVYEAACEDGDTAEQLLDGVQRIAGEKACERVILSLPRSNRLMQAALSRDIQVETKTDHELLVKLLNPVGIVDSMERILKERARAAELENGCVGLEIDDEKLTFDLEHGMLTVHRGGKAFKQAEWQISLPLIGLARAVLGTDRLGDRVGRRPGADGSVEAILNGLFPELHPYFWLADSL